MLLILQFVSNTANGTKAFMKSQYNLQRIAKLGSTKTLFMSQTQKWERKLSIQVSLNQNVFWGKKTKSYLKFQLPVTD